MDSVGEVTECTCISELNIPSDLYCTNNTAGLPRCIPVGYGISCRAHDVFYDHLCLSDNTDDIPAYCFEQWCYVDFESCFTSTESFHGSVHFKNLGLYYSYSICNSSSAPWDRQLVTAGVNSKQLLVSVPMSRYPYLYKRNSAGDIITDEEAYWNNDIPWEGIVVNYLDAIFQNEAVGVTTINYTHRSVLSATTYPESRYTAAVYDVSQGLTDFGAGDFWMTTDRLKMSPFSVPYYQGEIFLWVSESSSSGRNLMKLAQPFTTGTWVLFSFIVVLTSYVALWLSSKKKSIFPRYRERFRSDFYRNSDCLGKLKIAFPAVQDFVMMNFTSFFSGSVEFNATATYPYKLLMIGFSFMIMITYSAYVANLAAFLTTEAQHMPVTNMNDVIVKGLRICAPPALEGDLKTSWPDVPFVFNYNSTELTQGMIDDFDDNKCEGLVSSMRDIKVNKEYYGEFCKRNLISTGVAVNGDILSFPATHEVAPGLSYLIGDAATLGIKFEDFLKKSYYHICALDMSEEIDDMKSLKPVDMAFPIFVFFSCLIAAVAWQIGRDWMKKKKRLPNRQVKRARTLVTDFSRSEITSVIIPFPKLSPQNQNENDVCEVIETREMNDSFEINPNGKSGKTNSKSCNIGKNESEDTFDVREFMQLASRLKEISEIAGSIYEKKDL